MIDSAGKLLVFENFLTDHNLPKYKPKEEDGERNMKFADFSSDVSMNVVRSMAIRNGIVSLDVGSSTLPRGYLRWLLSWAIRKIASWFKSKVKEPEATLTIQEFFSSVKNTAQELAVVQERAAGYEKAILAAEQAGQRALLEQLQAGLNAYRQETQLVALDLKRFILEGDIVRFYKESPRGLRLDWVKNFTRPIPDGVLSVKVRADERGIFDNYVVLHYDPETKSYAETESEKAAKKDPILFGLVKGKRQLYFVGDWVDEVCDLTLDQLADKLGREAIQEIPAT